MLTYRDVEIPDQKMRTKHWQEVWDELTAEIVKPWIVFIKGRQHIAYGPWKVVEVSRKNGWDNTTIFKVMRENHRRSKIKVNANNIPIGKPWKGPPPNGWDQTPEGVLNLP